MINKPITLSPSIPVTTPARSPLPGSPEYVQPMQTGKPELNAKQGDTLPVTSQPVHIPPTQNKPELDAKQGDTVPMPGQPGQPPAQIPAPAPVTAPQKK